MLLEIFVERIRQPTSIHPWIGQATHFDRLILPIIHVALVWKFVRFPPGEIALIARDETKLLYHIFQSLLSLLDWIVAKQTNKKNLKNCPTFESIDMSTCQVFHCLHFYSISFYSIFFIVLFYLSNLFWWYPGWVVLGTLVDWIRQVASIVVVDGVPAI